MMGERQDVWRVRRERRGSENAYIYLHSAALGGDLWVCLSYHRQRALDEEELETSLMREYVRARRTFCVCDDRVRSEYIFGHPCGTRAERSNAEVMCGRSAKPILYIYMFNVCDYRWDAMGQMDICGLASVIAK